MRKAKPSREGRTEKVLDVGPVRTSEGMGRQELGVPGAWPGAW